MKYLIQLSTIIIIFALLGCSSKKQSGDETDIVNDLDSTVFPMEFLHNRDNSIYLFRTSFEKGEMSCIQLCDINLKSDLQNIIYYEFDLENTFYDNKTKSYIYANRKQNPTIKTSFLKVARVEPLNLNNFRVNTKKIENTISETFKYTIYNPSLKKNKAITLCTRYPKNDYSPQELELLDWIEKISQKISFKENLFFNYFKYQTKARNEFNEQFVKDNDFYKKKDEKKYAIPNSEVELFSSGSIAK